MRIQRGLSVPCNITNKMDGAATVAAFSTDGVKKGEEHDWESPEKDAMRFQE